jgi:hypothetical protein
MSRAKYCKINKISLYMQERKKQEIGPHCKKICDQGAMGSPIKGQVKRKNTSPVKRIAILFQLTGKFKFKVHHLS